MTSWWQAEQATTCTTWPVSGIFRIKTAQDKPVNGMKQFLMLTENEHVSVFDVRDR